MMFAKDGPLTRSEKLTIILVVVLLKLFAIGLFYDTDRDPDEEETESEKTGEEILEEFGWEDFWIMIYSMLIVVPVPIILKFFFSRQKFEGEDALEKIAKDKKKMLIKRIIGYFICFAVCVWCTWSIIMFSIEFGQNTSKIWLLNFGITTVGDVLVKEVLIAVILTSIPLCLPM